MKTIEIPTKSRGTLTVSTPSTKKDWELYSSMSGAGRAAVALTAALVRAMKVLVKDGSADAEMVADKIISPVCDKYAHVGASDTEPRSTATYTLRKFQRQPRGSDDSF